ncbi:MAG: bifunctional folylpolyglutamate synthase/dihydrofolate synthase [Chlamydiota bacterium]
MSYDTAVANLYALGHELARTPSHKFDLAHMRVLLAALGHPEQRFPSVLIAGTNGKGSTAATLASILRAAGYCTALYTSPHLVRLNQRIRIDGEEIADQDFAAIHDRVAEIANSLVATGELPWHPSFFEMLTAIAFEHFAQMKVDIGVLEVGMGGRLDATNVVEPLVSVITDISLDHQKFLGNTIAEIAGEKAGIIHRGGVVVTLPQHPAASDVIGNAVLERGARAVSAVPYVPPVSPAADAHGIGHARRCDGDSAWPTVETHSFRNGEPARATVEAHGFSRANKASEEEGALAPVPRTSYPLEIMGQEIRVKSPLIGRHQYRNIALAIATAVELNSIRVGTAAPASAGVRTAAPGCPGKRSSPTPFRITPAAIAQGIRETHWPGRFQIIPAHDPWPEFVLDVAHNPAGAWALRSALSQHYADRPLAIVFGAMRDKAIAEIAEILFPMAEHVVATRADNPRSATPEEIRDAAARTGAEVLCATNVPAALAQARSLAGSQGLVVITGSIYIVGEAMRELGLRA